MNMYLASSTAMRCICTSNRVCIRRRCIRASSGFTTRTTETLFPKYVVLFSCWLSGWCALWWRGGYSQRSVSEEDDGNAKSSAKAITGGRGGGEGEIRPQLKDNLLFVTHTSLCVCVCVCVSVCVLKKKKFSCDVRSFGKALFDEKKRVLCLDVSL